MTNRERKKEHDVAKKKKSIPMTPEQFAGRMRKIENDELLDTETGHVAADGLLVELLRDLGYGEGCDVFDGMGKWYA